MATQNGLNLGLSLSTGTGSFVGSNSPTLTTPTISQVNDANGNANFSFLSQASAVNYIGAANGATGVIPGLYALGSDTNIPIALVAKGTSAVHLDSQGLTNQVFINTGTSLVHNTIFNLPSSAASRTVTFPDANGTVTMLGNSSTGTGNVVLATSPIIATPQISQINDSHNNSVLLLNGSSSPVNAIAIGNADAGGILSIVASGSDTNIPIEILSKGTGQVILASTSNSALHIGSGTASQHLTEFSFANTNAIRNVAFQDADGTLCMDTSSSGSITTTPPVSAASTLALGTAYHNTLGYDIVLTVYVSVTAATSGSLINGVGPTSSPTQQTIVASLTVAAVTIIPVTIYLPSGYYALLSTGGTITATISGQQAMPV